MNTIEKLHADYQQDISIQKENLNQIKKKIRTVGLIRLLIVLLTIAAIYIYWGSIIVIATTIIVSLIAFLFFVVRHNKLFLKRDYIETTIRFDENELKAIDYDFTPFDGAKDRISSQHSFSLDLDVFGDKSLFQSINRTCTAYGKTLLADWFQYPEIEKKTILRRQKAVEELAQNPQLAKHFIVTGQLHPNSASDLKEMNEFISYPSYFLKNKIWKLLIYFIPCFWFVYILLISFGILPIDGLGLAIAIGLIIGESQMKKINQLQDVVGKKEKIFASYSDLITIIESENPDSEQLKKIRNNFFNQEIPTSKIIKQLSKLLSDLDMRFNVPARLLLNTLFLWDIRNAWRVEKWQNEYSPLLEKWIRALGEYDALFSLAIFKHNHPEYIFPEISEKYFVFEGKNLGHPLMNRNLCVKNDVNIPQNPYFMIVTGANMAGKSTYLRTLGINYLLACIGAPVCADSLKIYPAALVTSLRTSDSLSDNESYFFAELKRLKMIIERLNSGEKMFIILDEILKGTNSVDKQKGSFALVQQLVSLNTCGIIATHDLLLGNLADKFPEKIENFRFEADITGDELTFSYQLRRGIAQNMNACFLMKKMGITVEN